MVDDTRQRILRAYILAALVLGPAYASFFALHGAWWSFVAPATFTIVSLAAALLARGRHCRAAVTTLLAGLWLGPVWATLTTGGLRSPILVWLTPTPFMAGALLGRRAAVAVGAGSVLVVVGLGLSPGGVRAEMSAPTELRLLSAMAAASAVALLTFYGFATTKNFEDARARVEAQARDMQAVLDNVDQGLCLVARDGHVLAGHSAALTRWFGQPPEGALLWDFARTHHLETIIKKRGVPITRCLVDRGSQILASLPT